MAAMSNRCTKCGGQVRSCFPLSLGPALLPQNLQRTISCEGSGRPCAREKVVRLFCSRDELAFCVARSAHLRSHSHTADLGPRPSRTDARPFGLRHDAGGHAGLRLSDLYALGARGSLLMTGAPLSRALDRVRQPLRGATFYAGSDAFSPAQGRLYKGLAAAYQRYIVCCTGPPNPHGHDARRGRGHPAISSPSTGRQRNRPRRSAPELAFGGRLHVQVRSEDRRWLTECDDSGISRHGVSLLREVLAGLTPASIRRHTNHSSSPKFLLSSGIRFDEHIDGDAEDIFRHACKLRLEGIVSKLRRSAYRPVTGLDQDEEPGLRCGEARDGRGLGVEADEGAAMTMRAFVSADRPVVRLWHPDNPKLYVEIQFETQAAANAAVEQLNGMLKYATGLEIGEDA
jgi:hypothetical protein